MALKNIERRAILTAAFFEPRRLVDLSLSEWDLLIRQARRARVLARVYGLLERNDLLSLIPSQVLRHLESARIHADQMKVCLRWELICMKRAFDRVKIPLILLKGAAYAVAGDDAALGRVFSDIDILVPKHRLEEAERALIFEGWKSGHIDPYDQLYYRKWMHEIPPMQHVQRRSTIDVHHNILPITCRLCPDPEKLLENITNVPGTEFWVLSPADRVIHSAVHLFHEGDFEHGFRDLSDLDLLIKQFGTEDEFWEKLIQRSDELKQQVPLYYALRFTTKIFRTPIPAHVLEKTLGAQPSVIKRKLMDFLFLRVLIPNHESCRDSWTKLASWLLYVRSHWLRMPWYLLILHLSKKAWMRMNETQD
ncbi:MAG: nucleotidyltransferase domain-containing protein [Gammaproteobacteria bacterium]